MHFYSIKNLLDLPKLFVQSTKKIDGQIFIDAVPVATHQPCPVCTSTQTIRQGVNFIRKVRHLDSFGCVVYLTYLSSVYPVLLAALILFGPKKFK